MHQKRFCVYTDGSDLVWSAIVTKFSFKDLRRPRVDKVAGKKASMNLWPSYSITSPNPSLSGRSPRRRHSQCCKRRATFIGGKRHWTVLTCIPTTTIQSFYLIRCRSCRTCLWPHYVRSCFGQSCSADAIICVYRYLGQINVWACSLGLWSVSAFLCHLIWVLKVPLSSAFDYEWPALSSTDES